MQMMNMMGVGAEAVDVTVVMGMIQVTEATTEVGEVAITEVATTEVATTEVATTEVATTEVATTDVAVTKVATINNFCYLTTVILIVFCHKYGHYLIIMYC